MAAVGIGGDPKWVWDPAQGKWVNADTGEPWTPQPVSKTMDQTVAPTTSTSTYGAAGPLAFGSVSAFGQTPPTFTAPGYTAPPPFQAPSIAEAMNQPGYKFQVQQGQNALQNWAGAKGTLNDSGTADALQQFGQSAAQSDYANVFNQDLQQYNVNYQTQFTDPYAIKYQGAYGNYASRQQSWQDAYNAWLSQQQLQQNEQGLYTQAVSAGL